MLLEIEKSSKGRILVADDEQAFRLATRAFLRQQGYECEVAPDAAAAAEWLGKAEFDLLISDINMPGNSGLEFIQRLPGVAAGLPVILVTGHPTFQSAARSVGMQVVAYLVKPADPDELLHIAERAIASRRAFRSLNANRERINEWLADLAKAEKSLTRTETQHAGTPADDASRQALHDVASMLRDLQQFAGTLAHRVEVRETNSDTAIEGVLRDAVAVLQKSRQSFKSRELGELRRRLEALLKIPS